MASSYTGLGTELMTTGENAGNWGTKTNVNLQILEEAIRGYVAVSANSDQTLSLTDGSTGDSIRNSVIAFTGTLSANRTITVPAVEKWWIMDNQTAGAYTLTVKVSDGSVFSATKTITINVTDINDLAPAVVDSSFSINENVASGTSVGTPRATDGDGSSTTFSGWTITSGNAAGKFAINSSTGAITTAASVNHEETSSYTLGITVSDGTNTSSAGTINIATVSYTHLTLPTKA